MRTVLAVSNEEIRTVREAMRDLKRILEKFDTGELEKVVLFERNQMRAVIVPIDGYRAPDLRARQIGEGRGIGGQQLTDLAHAVLREEGELHYREVLGILQDQGHTIRGDDPSATLLSAMHRDPRLVCAKARTGRYRLREEP